MKLNKTLIYITTTLLVSLACFSSAYTQDHVPDSLEHYIRIAIENNPGIKTQSLAHQAFLERIPQAGAYPDPELSLELYTMPMEIVGGRSIANISLMQMFPWFGTRNAARTEARHMANMQDQQFRETVNDLIFQVSAQWFNLKKLSKQLDNNEENKKILTQLEQLALRNFSSPGMSDVLRIQLEIAEIENNIASLYSQISAEKAKFNALLNREAHEEVVLGKEIIKLTFLYSENEALAIMEKNNPMLEMISEEGLAFSAKVEMDKKMSYPMIGLGVQYMVVGQTDNMILAMEGMNGKDMFMPMVSVSLPIFRKKYTAQQKESELWRKSTEQNYTNTLNILKSDYYSLKSQLDDSERMLNLYEKQTVLAQTTYNLILKEFVAGESDLANVIQVQRQLLDYQLKKSEALAGYNTIVVSIKKLLAEQY